MRDYNFAAGPAMLPYEVLTTIKNEIFNWQGTGVSIMEIGHRTSNFQDMLNDLQNKLRQVMNIPPNYKVLFVQGGAQGQFSAIPMNLIRYNQNVDYVITGTWSKRAAKFASKYASVNIVNQDINTGITPMEEWTLNKNASYVYYCPNETINGVAFDFIPMVNDIPLVADMTSNILSSVTDISKFGVVFASAQKNLGIAGVTLVIVRDDLLDRYLDINPDTWQYKLLADMNSLINTVPVFSIYVMNLMVDWVIKQGGVEEIARINHTKANKLYNYIDSSDFYFNLVDKKYRSLVNIPFNLINDSLLSEFLLDAQTNGLRYLKGHSLVGGVRASLYNSMPAIGVDKLIEFMDYFAIKHITTKR